MSRSGLKVLLSDEPQLAVCHGLVIARMQANSGSADILSRRCCPVSFGILTREMYDPEKHRGEKIVKDSFDNRMWAPGQINWILRQGQVVNADYGVSERYALKIEMGREYQPWKTTIVMSTLPADQLPRSMSWGGANVVCSIDAVLDKRDMHRRNKHWYNIRKEYNQAEFLVQMLVCTGLRFEIWSVDGNVRSRGHEEIAIEWVDPDTRGRNNERRADPGLFEAFEAACASPKELSGAGIFHELEGSPTLGKTLPAWSRDTQSVTVTAAASPRSR